MKNIAGMMGALGLAFLTACSSTLLAQKEAIISSPQIFGTSNYSVIRIDPNGQSVHLDWKGFIEGDMVGAPYDEIFTWNESGKYFITDRGAGNNELYVNGRLYRLHSRSEQLVVRFGSGVSVESGGNYQSALKLDAADFSKLRVNAEPKVTSNGVPPGVLVTPR